VSTRQDPGPGVEAIAPGTVPGQRYAPTRVQLANGLAVIAVRHPAADVVALQIWLGVGARDEEDRHAGLSHFIEHLVFKGTATRGRGEIDRIVAGCGGELNAATSHDYTCYHAVVPSGHADTVLEVLGDAVMSPLFDAGEVERERLVVLEEIRRANDSPAAYLSRLLRRQRFAGHPYGRPVLGTAGSLGGTTREDLVAYHGHHYAAANATLVLVGRLDPERALPRVAELLGGWARGVAPARLPAPIPESAHVRRVEEPRDVRQTYLGMVWPGPVVPHPDVYAVDLLTSILGGGRSSRLYQGLKERRALVAAIGAGHGALREGGTITVTARTDCAESGQVEAAVLEEVERLRETEVGDAELERARTAVEGGYAFAFEAAEGVAHASGLAETLWTLDFELGYLPAIAGVTPEAIRAAARRYLTPDRFVRVGLVPRETAG
jgi:zinc protease